jgi:hypothetical protein
MMAWLWRVLPVGRLSAAWWAWRNRRELGRWIRFAWRAVPGSPRYRSDLLAEARLRAAFARDRSTRGVRSLSLHVVSGIAFLEGSLPPDIHDLAAAIASRTNGVVRVDCAIRDRGRRHGPQTHPHRVAALPPPPPPHPSLRSIS